MELRQLEYFLAVADELNFTRAAIRLHVVQPAVSATVAGLERELKTRLFDRTSRRVDLTEAGRAFLPRARATLEAARAAVDSVSDVHGAVQGALRIGTMSSLGVIDLASLLGDFHTLYPDVTVRLVTAASGAGSPGLIQELVDGRIDVGFLSLPTRSSTDLNVIELVSTPLDLVFPADDPLAAREQLRMSDLQDRMFVDFPVGYGNRAVTDAAFRAAGVTREVAIEITALPSGPDFVRRGLGIAFLPRNAADPFPDLRAMPITGANLAWPIFLATPRARTLTAAARAFEQFVSEHLRDAESVESRD